MPVHDLVLDDLVVLRPGDQMVADGVVLRQPGLEVDESLLTGEADPVGKAAGDQAAVGQLRVAGSGRYQATAVGAAAYACQLAAEARRFTLVRSELRAASTGSWLCRWAIIPAAGDLAGQPAARARHVAPGPDRPRWPALVAMVPRAWCC